MWIAVWLFSPLQWRTWTVTKALKPGGMLLVAEPANHVSWKNFDQSLRKAREAGLRSCAREPKIRSSRSEMLVR